MKITLHIDDEIAEKVRTIAADKNTTMNAMVRDYLTSLANTENPVLDAEARMEGVERLRESWASRDNDDPDTPDAAARKEAADRLRENIDQLKRPMGTRNWNREDLYDRPYAYRKRD